MAQVLDFLLVMDIVLQFFRAYVNKKSVLVVKMSRIRRNYLGMAPHTVVNAALLCSRYMTIVCSTAASCANPARKVALLTSAC